ncbi:MAG: hypothetical protein QW059_01620 [Nitrososphaerota archaeon]
MATLITSIIDPLVILIIMLTSIVLPALLLRRERMTGGSVPRNYIEEIDAFFNEAADEKPVDAVETLLIAYADLGVLRGWRAGLWRVLLAGRLTRLLPARIYRWILGRLVNR